MAKQTKEQTYLAEGLHCASCELLIENRLLKEKGIVAVEASAAQGRVKIKSVGHQLTLNKLNQIFRSKQYHFASLEERAAAREPLFAFSNGQLLINRKSFVDFSVIAGICLAIIAGFLLLNRSGLAALVSVNRQSALPAFWLFGLLAGFSTCSALVGGLVLSMTKQWGKQQQLQPHILFNLSRLLAYFLFGAILGALGGSLQVSSLLTATLTLVVSAVMIFLGLQMLGWRALQRFQVALPKPVTRYIANGHFGNRLMPAAMGFLTFFLPCGFTVTAQGLALLSGSWLQGGLIMLSFALGTLPALLLIGLSSAKLVQKPHLAGRFLKIAGGLVLFFGVFNINSQLNVLGLKNLSSLRPNVADNTSQDGLAPVVKGKQLLEMGASASSYEPSYFKVRAGLPVRWEITDKGISGCTSAIISRGLFAGQINLTQGGTSVKEFTPSTPGKYKFSCWMGMVSGVIEVVGA